MANHPNVIVPPIIILYDQENDKPSHFHPIVKEWLREHDERSVDLKIKELDHYIEDLKRNMPIGSWHPLYKPMMLEEAENDRDKLLQAQQLRKAIERDESEEEPVPVDIGPIGRPFGPHNPPAQPVYENIRGGSENLQQVQVEAQENVVAPGILRRY